MPDLPTPLVMALAGFVCGFVAGLAARAARFCTFGAVEDALLGGNLTRLKAWALAIALAMVLVQIMHVTGIARIGQSFYLAPSFGWLGAIAGGLMFGVGMAFVGTCGYGTIIRLGGGDLRYLVVFMVMGLTAYMTARGLTGVFREAVIEPWNLDLAALDGQGLPHIIGGLTGVAAAGLWLPMAALIAVAIVWWCLADRRFRRSRRDVVAGLAMGSAVAGGFFATGALGDDPFEVQRVLSLSYVLPPGETIVYLLTYSGATIDFGIGMILGTGTGAFLAAARKRELRLEAFDDAREMRRHLFGAVLMGFGGVSALGCTIGQGISGMATLSASAPLALLAILIGASGGLFYLMTGSVREAWALARESLVISALREP